MFSKKMQIIKFEQNHCNANVNNNSVLFVRVSGEVTDKHAQFEIPLTHVGYVIKGGGDGRLYQSGHYPVFEDKREIKAWKKGFSVEIVYMPKDTDVLINWGTPNKVSYRDEASNHVIEVGARVIATYKMRSSSARSSARARSSTSPISESVSARRSSTNSPIVSSRSCARKG